jgi:hypothetical protein
VTRLESFVSIDVHADLAGLHRADEFPILDVMFDGPNRADARPYDVLVIGAGICGVIFLKYALERGLRCLVLEKQADVGGLWTWLPAWQDIQNRKEDYALDDVPLDGVAQPDIQRYVCEWVRRYDLGSYIRLSCEVTSVSWLGERWKIETPAGTYQSKFVVAATGVENEPWIPSVERSQSVVSECHSSRLHRPDELAGRRVTVVGSGASALDLLGLAVDNNATQVHWLYRHVRWFLPTRAPKQRAWPNLRELSIVQTLLKSPERVSAFMRWMLRVLYGFFDLTDIEPTEPFDIRKHQLIPGRASMLAHLEGITRHQGEIRHIRGREVELKTGERFETDVLLWGTGYRMNLRYLALPELRGIDRLDDLLPKLGSLLRCVDYPNLFFIGMSLTDSTSATPFIAAVEAKSLVAHMLGECEIPMEYTPYKVNHWNLFKYFASFDDANYPGIAWKARYALFACWYALLRNKAVKIQ